MNAVFMPCAHYIENSGCKAVLAWSRSSDKHEEAVQHGDNPDARFVVTDDEMRSTYAVDLYDRFKAWLDSIHEYEFKRDAIVDAERTLHLHEPD